MRRKLLKAVAAAAVASAALAVPAGAHPHYRVVDLGTLGGPTSDARDVTDGGLVAGTADIPTQTASGDRVQQDHHAFLWRLGVMQDLPALLPPGGQFGVCSCADGNAVNAGGEIVGWDQSLADLVPGAWLDGAEIGVPPVLDFPLEARDAWGVDDAGTVVGGSGNPWLGSDLQSPFVAPSPASGEPAFAIRIVPHAGGGAALDVNAAGWVVGGTDRLDPRLVDVPFHRSQAFLWHAGTASWLLPGSHLPSLARSIDDGGDAVGVQLDAQGGSHAFLAPLRRHVRFLGHLAGGTQSDAEHITDAGLIVGWADDASGEHHAVAAFPSANGPGRLVDLNRLVADRTWTLLDAHSANDSGWIVGQGRIAGQLHGFLLVPR